MLIVSSSRWGHSRRPWGLPCRRSGHASSWARVPKSIGLTAGVWHTLAGASVLALGRNARVPEPACRFLDPSVEEMEIIVR